MESHKFKLHEQLAKDCVELGNFPLCTVLLCKDANYPWCILVPRQNNIKEIHHLSIEHQTQLLRESVFLSSIMESLFNAGKMNVAALGNLVPQLHLHHIARFENDVAWPKPIWNAVPIKEYRDNELNERIELLQAELLSPNISNNKFVVEFTAIK